MKTLIRHGLTGAALAVAIATTSIAQADTLTANIAFKGASQRAVWQQTFDAFKKAHPDIDVKVTFVDEEAYKVQLPGWLTTVAPEANFQSARGIAELRKVGVALVDDAAPKLCSRATCPITCIKPHENARACASVLEIFPALS